LDPTRAFRFQVRGDAHRVSGDLIPAIADYSEAIRLDPTKRLFRFYARGNAFRDTAQYKRALSDYAVAQQLEPNNGWVLLERGRTYARMGQVQSARTEFDAALTTNQTDSELRGAVERELAQLPTIAIAESDSPKNQPPASFPSVSDFTQPSRQQHAADGGLSSVAPSLRHPSHGGRVAVLVVPGAARGNARNVIAHADEEAYRKLLRDIGFDVLTISPSSRPDLDQALREAARRVPNGGEIAMFVLGTALSDANELYVMPADAPAEAEMQPGGLDAAGLRLGDVLRRIHARAPRHFVVIVDECRRITCGGPECAVEATAGTTGASIIAAHRISARAGSNAPLAQRTSIRDLLTPEMVKEGQNFFSLFGSLTQRLAGSNIALISTSALSNEFSFVPANYFATLPTDCNRVAANADANVLRTVNLEPLLQACERATSTWPYAPHFAAQLAVVREQRAFQRAVASCDDRAAIPGYASTYPSGRYKAVVQQFEADCRTRLAELQEERDYQDAIASCGNFTPARGYQMKYPNGRYRREVNEFVSVCERKAQREHEHDIWIAGDECDRLAANPHDLRKSTTAPGITYGDLSSHANEAALACEKAAHGFPNEPRFRYQHARALQHVDRNKAFSIHEGLVRLQYPAAYDNLGWLYITDRNSEASAIGHFRAGSSLGDPDSMVSLAEMIIRGKTQSRGSGETVLALYCRAAQLGHIEAMQGCQRAQDRMQIEQQRLMLDFFGGIIRNISQQ
jgi:tetratricopeptide (TPR) repeat protein